MRVYAVWYCKNWMYLLLVATYIVSRFLPFRIIVLLYRNAALRMS